MGNFKFKSFKNVSERFLNASSITIAKHHKNRLEELKSTLNEKLKQKFILK